MQFALRLGQFANDRLLDSICQVGPPPGGPAYVLLYVPVVFFTAKGIPGEVDERLDTKDGIISASSRALTKGETNRHGAYLM